MEKFHELQEKANASLLQAQNTLLFTYRMVKSPKLLLAITEQLNEATSNSLDALLLHQKTWGKISKYKEDLKSKLRVLKEKVIVKNEIDEEIINVILELKKIIQEHKKSPIEFERKGDLVMCSDKYKMKIVKVEDIKHHFEKAKLFIQQTNNIITQND